MKQLCTASVTLWGEAVAYCELSQDHGTHHRTMYDGHLIMWSGE